MKSVPSCFIILSGDLSMKKIDVVNLIKAHMNNDNQSFKLLALQIADEFENSGDKDLSKAIQGFVSDSYSLSYQTSDETSIGFLHLVPNKKCDLYLPDSISSDLIGVYNAVNRNVGINKFMFYGAPGTGKTEAAKLIANKLKRELWMVSIRDLIDAKLGETSKNIYSLFKSINDFPNKKKMLVLFDELDSLALNRIDSRDLREMGRATTELFSGLDYLDKDVVLIATTNLFKDFDKALVRRFNKTINFSRYEQEDLIELASIFYSEIISNVDNVELDNKLFKKIITTYLPLPNPGELKNIINSSIAFSDPNNPRDYLSRLVSSLDTSKNALDIENLQRKGFSLREIAKIVNNSKSVIGRKLNNGKK